MSNVKLFIAPEGCKIEVSSSSKNDGVPETIDCTTTKSTTISDDEKKMPCGCRENLICEGCSCKVKKGFYSGSFDSIHPIQCRIKGVCPNSAPFITGSAIVVMRVFKKKGSSEIFERCWKCFCKTVSDLDAYQVKYSASDCFNVFRGWGWQYRYSLNGLSRTKWCDVCNLVPLFTIFDVDKYDEMFGTVLNSKDLNCVKCSHREVPLWERSCNADLQTILCADIICRKCSVPCFCPVHD